MKRFLLALLALALCLGGCSPREQTAPPTDEPSPAPSTDECLLILDGRRYSFHGGADKISAKEDRITILAEGTYRIQGTLTEGALRVSAPPTATVHLIFDSASITSSYHPPLLLEEAACVILEAEEGSVNRLTDAKRPSTVSADSRGCLVSRCRLILQGKGTLCVSGRQETAILCEDDLHLSQTVLTLSAPHFGMRVRDSLRMESGALTVSAAKEGLVADGGSASVGALEFLGGRLTLSCSEVALVASSYIRIGEAQVSVSAPTRYQAPAIYSSEKA